MNRTPALALAAAAVLGLAACSEIPTASTTPSATTPPSPSASANPWTMPPAPSLPALPAPAAPTPNTATVVYEVTSDQPIHSVDYMDEGGFSNSQNLPATWKKTVTIDAPYGAPFTSVAAQAAWYPANPSFITCKITVDGVVKVTKTGHGEGATVDCSTH